MKKSYAPNCIRTEVTVPRRTPEDLADIVVYEDNKCQNPYLVVETKKEKISERQRKQAIEQLFGNANSLRIPLALYENNEESILYDVLNFPSTERNENIKGNRDAVPVLMNVGLSPEFAQVVYRFGESVAFGLTPIFAYFVIYLAYMEKYNQNKKPINLFRTIKYQLPYSLASMALYLVLIIVWYITGLPVGF